MCTVNVCARLRYTHLYQHIFYILYHAMQILITYHYSYYIHTTNLHNIMKYKLYMTALPINMEYDLYCLLIYCIK